MQGKQTKDKLASLSTILLLCCHAVRLYGVFSRFNCPTLQLIFKDCITIYDDKCYDFNTKNVVI